MRSATDTTKGGRIGSAVVRSGEEEIMSLGEGERREAHLSITLFLRLRIVNYDDLPWQFCNHPTTISSTSLRK